MKLSYRGIVYDRSSMALNAKVEKQSGKYRGQSSSIANFERFSLKQSSSCRTYRGVSYN